MGVPRRVCVYTAPERAETIQPHQPGQRLAVPPSSRDISTHLTLLSLRHTRVRPAWRQKEINKIKKSGGGGGEVGEKKRGHRATLWRSRARKRDDFASASAGVTSQYILSPAACSSKTYFLGLFPPEGRIDLLSGHFAEEGNTFLSFSFPQSTTVNTRSLARRRFHLLRNVATPLLHARCYPRLGRGNGDKTSANGDVASVTKDCVTGTNYTP